jgi:hypothetical protein|tara:strand:- start:4625 stop:5044 length:420 start_codon:yes stop_codon:yes gene_type:complete
MCDVEGVADASTFPGTEDAGGATTTVTRLSSGADDGVLCIVCVIVFVFTSGLSDGAGAEGAEPDIGLLGVSGVDLPGESGVFGGSELGAGFGAKSDEVTGLLSGFGVGEGKGVVMRVELVKTTGLGVLEGGLGDELGLQ